nr:ImmA/IrrE family metallo-endopeptidase [uncultured Sphingosinicella sp.]
MKISRLDLDGVGSPAALAARIHELEPGLPPKLPLEELCACLDIQSITELETQGFEAALVMDDLKASGAILLAKDRPPKRRRYSIAHELGHFLIPTHLPVRGRPLECSLDDFHLPDPKDRDRRRRIEAEANRFAAHLLMPPERVRTGIGQSGSSLEGIIAMAGEFGVSKEAMARSWVQLHREPVAILVVHHGWVIRRYRNDDFPWLPDHNGQLPPESVAALEWANAGFSETEDIDPSAWLSDRDARRTLSLTEQVLGQRNGYALILLQAELDDGAV